MALSRRHVLAGFGALGVGGWRQSQPIDAAFTGTTRLIGPGQTYATIAAAHTAASSLDRLIVVSPIPKETFNITKNIMLDFSVCAGASAWDFTGVPPGAMPGGGKGAIEIDGTQVLLIAGEIMNVGTDPALWPGADKTAAVRISSLSGTVTVYGGYFHDCQNGVASDDGLSTVITLNGTRLAHCGLTSDLGHAHNAYLGPTTLVQLINVDSRNPLGAHAMKCRALTTRAYGGFYQSDPGASFDLPEGGFFELRNLTMQKLATSTSINVLNYATENFNAGLQNANAIRNCVLDLQVSGQAIHTIGGQITFAEGNSRTAFAPGAPYGGGVVIGQPT